MKFGEKEKCGSSSRTKKKKEFKPEISEEMNVTFNNLLKKCVIASPINQLKKVLNIILGMLQ